MSELANKNLLGILGYPVDHSLSPVIFDWLANRTGTSLQYHRLSVPEDRLQQTLPVLRDLGIFLGWNVTLPHKQSILSHLDNLSSEAKMIGAVNVIAMNSRGQFKGHNTDFFGIQETLREQGWDPKGKEALILGAGGAAFAVGAVLGKGKVKRVKVANRNSQRSQILVKKLSPFFPRTSFEVISWEKPWDTGRHSLEKISLVVNSTPLGMKGFPEGDFDRFFSSKIATDALAFDLIYNPLQTPFLKMAKRKGIRAVGGLDMLIWQALRTWEIWFGRIEPQASLPKIQKELKRVLERKFS